MKKGPKDIVNRLKCWWDNREERCGESHVYCRDCPLHVPGYSMEDAVKDTIAYIYRLETAQPKWISVEERLPEDGVNVLTLSSKGFHVMKRIGSEWCIETRGYTGVAFYHVTHWTPLPEPPKEG